MQRGSKENFIPLVLFVAAAPLVVTAAILIGYFFVKYLPPAHLAAMYKIKFWGFTTTTRRLRRIS